MSILSLIRLIDSMSKEEKRKFKLSTKKQIGKKDYIELFDIIDKSTGIGPNLLKEKFTKLHPHGSMDNTARYLMDMLTDGLVQTKIKEDNWFHLYYGLLRVKLLQARSLEEEGNKELKKIKTLAAKSQDSILQYIIYRYEMDYLSALNFSFYTEKDLIETQMQARNLLKDIRNIHEHHSLYELLKYRLIHSGKNLSEENKKKLNDLILTEMSIVAGKDSKNFESQKLHLLFQSFFFISIGDYKSALKVFYVLNKLFEQNKNIWGSPPLDYLASLDGILDSLRVIGYHEEIDFYLKKMEQLDTVSYPEFFRFLVKKIIMIYQLVTLTTNKKFKMAVEIFENSDPNLLTSYSMVDDEKQNELLFYIARSYFGTGNFKKALKYINEIIIIYKINYQSPIYKAARLLSIIIHYESNDLEYLDYEIRSYKRVTQNKIKFLKIEVIIFKTIKLHPKRNVARKNEILWKKLLPTMKAIEKSKYEMQLGQYFDFPGWVKNNFFKTAGNDSF